MRKYKRLAIQLLSVLCLLCITNSALAGSLVLPTGLVEIEDEAFEGIAATTVVIPATTERIGSRAFADSSITDVFLPANEIQIENDAFDLDSDLTFHVYMGSVSANWAIDHKEGHNYQIEYLLGDGSDHSTGGWGDVADLVASESTDPASNNPYYTKRLIVRLKPGYELPDLTCFNYKEIVPLDKNRYVIQFEDSQKTMECDIALQAWGGCQNIEKDFFLSSSDGSNATLTLRSANINPDDPMGFDAYTEFLGDSVGHVTIAVIDCGINISQVGSNVVESCYDLAINSTRSSGYESHGTNVTKEIVNAFGSLATTKHLTILGYNIKVNGEYSYLLMVKAIDMARAAGADYINISIAGASQLVSEQDNMELKWAIDDFGRGRIFAAAGNHSSSASNYLPGKYCTPIGAVQLNGDGILRRADQTCTGATYSGYSPNTSYATAKVTAAMALVSLDPSHSSFPLWGDDSDETILENGAPMPKLDELAITKTTEIIINEGEPIESVLEVGNRPLIYYEVLPDSATDKTITVTSSDDSIISVVDLTGRRVRIQANAPGTAELTFTPNDNGATPVVVTFSVIKQVISVSLSAPTDDVLMLNETRALSATVTPGDATDKSLRWTSSNNTIAEVSQTGVVTQKGDGTVIIRATSNSNTSAYDEIEIECSSVAREDRVVVSAPKDTIGIGNTAETLQMQAVVYPENAPQTVVWSVDREEIATIDQNGLLTAVSDGQVIVTAMTISGRASGCMGVTVVQLPTSVTINGSDTVNVDETMPLTATVTPDNARDKTVVWSSSRTAVATVDAETGLVTGVSEGTAVIIAKCNADNSITDYYAISVTILPDSVIIVPPTATTIDIDETLALSATVSPSNASNKTVTWSTNDSSIATVSSSGVVTAKAPGNVTITASTVNNKTDSIALTVRQPYTLSFNANGGTCSTSSWTCYSGYAIGGTLPTPTRTGYTFAGWWTAASGGSQVATPTSFTSSSTVTIYAHWNAIMPTAITLSTSVSTINVGSTTTISATITPSDAANKNITWSSSNTSVATVSSSGVVTGVRSGTVNITATSVATSSVTNSISITVRQPYTLSFNANGGTLTGVSSKTVYAGQQVGTLSSNPTRSGCTFKGWYTAANGGTQITTTTNYNWTSSITAYAHWESDNWALESAVPSGAKIIATSWSYRESTESTSSSLSGWTANGMTDWRQTGTGSKEYASFPSTYKTSHSTYTQLNGSAYESYENETTKRTVSNAHGGYVYWHWMYSRAYDGNSSGTAPISSKSGNQKISSSGPTYAFNYFYAIKSTTDCPYLGTGYCCNQNIKNYDCRSIIPSNADTSSNSGLGTYRFFRLEYFVSTYTDYQKLYKYYRDVSYSTTDPGNGSNITNKTKYVKWSNNQ